MEKIEIKNDKKQTVFEAIKNSKSTINFSMLKTALRKRDIKVDGKRISQNIVIDAGAQITVFLNDKKPKQVEKVFEDDNVIIALKPQGMEVTKADKAFLDSDCLEDILNAVAVHRLDKNTEGLVVLAKNDEAKNSLLTAFKNHNIKKKYLALCYGKIDKNGENFENYIKKEQNYAKICEKNDKNGKIAKLSYKFIEGKNGLCLLQINLETGRTHQIRAQLSYHKIYVLGDEKYGQKEINKKYHKSKQQLCAYSLTFEKLSAPLEYLSGKTFEIKQTFDINDFNDIK